MTKTTGISDTPTHLGSPLSGRPQMRMTPDAKRRLAIAATLSNGQRVGVYHAKRDRFGSIVTVNISVGTVDVRVDGFRNLVSIAADMVIVLPSNT